MFTKTVLAILTICVLTGCIDTKRVGLSYLRKDQKIYEKDAKGTYVESSRPQRTLARITPKANSLELNLVAEKEPGPLKPGYKVLTDQIDKGKAAPLAGQSDALSQHKTYVFPAPPEAASAANCKPASVNFQYYKGGKLVYIDKHLMVQAMSIPVKLRLPLNDTIRATASSSFTLGITVGRKITYNKFRCYYSCAQKETLNSKTTRFTIAYGGFFGPVFQELKKETTEGHVKNARTAVGPTVGGFVVFGVNQFNVGGALGFDHPLGAGSEYWVYRYKPWIGLIIALDLVK